MHQRHKKVIVHPNWVAEGRKDTQPERYPDTLNRRTVQRTCQSLPEQGQAWFCVPHSALQGFQLHSLSSAHGLPRGADSHGRRPARPSKKEIRWQAVYSHFRQWSQDGSLKQVWQGSMAAIEPWLDLSELNLDGAHASAQKGGASVAYAGRKKAKTPTHEEQTRPQAPYQPGRVSAPCYFRTFLRLDRSVPSAACPL